MFKKQRNFQERFKNRFAPGVLPVARALLCVTFLFGLTLSQIAAASLNNETPPPEFGHEAPRIRSMLEHGWAAEKGIGQLPNAALAASLYCEAARFSSAEAHYRAGILYASSALADPATAAAFFRSAWEVGRDQAFFALVALVARAGGQKALTPTCVTDDSSPPLPDAPSRQNAPKFDFQGYIAAMSAEKKKIATLLVKHAPSFGVEIRLALAIAGVESNFDAAATSPKNAQGVMQLIPETAARFKVKNPYDAEQNIRGGLAYLRWLSDYFRGDLVRVIAAYNAGEGAVIKHKGVPPYQETRLYLKRVLALAGIGVVE